MQNGVKHKKDSQNRRPHANWKGILLGTVLCLLTTCAAGMMLEANPDSVVGEILMCIAIFTFMLGAAALVIHILKAITRKAIDKHETPKETVYWEVGRSVPGASGKYETPADTGYYKESRSEPPKVLNAASARRIAYNGSTIYRTNAGSELSWGWVAVALFLLPPLGVFYMVQKAISERVYNYVNGVKMIVIGTVYMLCTVPIIVLIWLGGGDSVRTHIVATVLPGAYALIGLFSFILGLFVRHYGKIQDVYMNAILNEQITRIDVLARRARATYADATAVIQKLIDTDRLPGAYIYHKDREVIVPGISKKIAFYCSNCGGTTVQYANETKVCVYCGAKQ